MNDAPAIVMAFNRAMEDAACCALFTLLNHGDLPEGTEIFAFIDKDVAYDKIKGFKGVTVRLLDMDYEPGDPLTNYHDKNFPRGASLMTQALDELHHQGYNRVMWLDADTFVRTSIRKLLEVDLGEFTMGACRDFHGDQATLKEHDVDWDYKTGKNFKGYYFNTGVMVFDLQRFYKQYNLDVDGLEGLIVKNGHRYRFMDQCMLNELVEEQYVLPQKYNWFPDWYTEQRDNPLEWHKSHIFNQDAAIIHFVGPWKPWKDPIPESPVKYQLRVKEYFRLTRPIHGILSRWWWHNVRANLPQDKN